MGAAIIIDDRFDPLGHKPFEGEERWKAITSSVKGLLSSAPKEDCQSNVSHMSMC